MPKKFLLATVAALALGALSFPVLAADDAAGGDAVVARVNGEEIHRSDVLREVKMAGPQAQQMPISMIYPQLLQKLVATRLVAAQGYAQKLQNDKEVKDQMKELEQQVVAEVYVRRTVQPKITDAKIKERYDQLAAKFKPQDEVRARHILVKTEDEAKDIVKQLQGGADFAKLAQDKSADTASAKQGGDLGYFPREAMDKAFADAAFGMKVGEVSAAPVKTEFGWHVIKVEDKRKSSPPPLADVKDQIANQLGQEMTDELVRSLQAKAKVEKFNLDGTPMKATDEGAKKP
jgi:peptidyl-prolyl cis-trans isomerase C